MGRDRSLDEFFGGEGDASDAESEDARVSGDAGGDADAVESDPEDERPAATDADPATEAEVEVEAEAKDDDSDGDGDADGSEDADAESDALPDADAVDPATPTYRWTPEGAACESCGAVAERRWEDDGAFVCDDCKEW